MNINKVNIMIKDGFITPVGHSKFFAKKLFDEMGKIKWGALAYIEAGGGGPEGNHTHEDDHIFIVVEGEVKIYESNKANIVKKDEMFYVKGSTPHSIWNNGTETAKVIKISVSESN